MKRSIPWVLLVGLVACDAKKADPKPEPTKTADPTPKADVVMPDLKFVGEPVKQAADFPKLRWVKTTLFGTKKPVIGFTYVDPSKGNSLKGEIVDDLKGAELKAKLGGGNRPGMTMSPIPEGHAMTLLTDAEIKELGLVAKPDWLTFYGY
jgi:hypothetical protein